jgi:hypothetical protein
LLCIAIPFIEMVFTTSPLFYWYRWVLLLVYPLMFFAVRGLDRLWNFWSRHKNKIKSSVPKVFAIVYIAFLLVMSGAYLLATPQNQISYFLKDNNYLAFIPSCMDQNSLPISDNPSLVKCFEWINNNNEDSTVVMNSQLYYYAVICLNKITVTSLQEPNVASNSKTETTLSQQMVADANTALADGNSTVYTVWWVKGEGWYAISALPTKFTEVYRSGDMAVYVFNATA